MASSSAEESTSLYNSIVVVDSADLLKDALEQVNKATAIALDCEGDKLGRKGTLDVLSLATKPDKNVYLFDIKTMGKTAFDGGLRTLLEDGGITKLMFDCRNDADALKHLYHVTLRGVHDVQLMEVSKRLQDPESQQSKRQRHSNSSSNNYWQTVTKNVPRLNGLKKCIEKFLSSSEESTGGMNDKQDAGASKDLVAAKAKITREMDRAKVESKNIWEVRPLSEVLKEYCAIDTCTLFSLYDILKEGQDMEEIRKASDRYVDYKRSYSKVPSRMYVSHCYLPHNILQVDIGGNTICTGCKKCFSSSEFSKTQIRKGIQVCRVCRLIEEKGDVRANQEKMQRREEEYNENSYYESGEDSFLF